MLEAFIRMAAHVGSQFETHNAKLSWGSVALARVPQQRLVRDTALRAALPLAWRSADSFDAKS